MANPQHVEIVKQGSDAIEQFRNANKEVVFDLSDIRSPNELCLVLHEQDWLNPDRLGLSGADFSNTVLLDVKLDGINFENAIFAGARFEGQSTIRRSRFTRDGARVAKTLCGFARSCPDSHHTLAWSKEDR